MKADLEELNETLASLEKELSQSLNQQQQYLELIPPGNQPAARNLIQYLCFRSEDRKDLQEKLHLYGLSALSNSENHIHRQIQVIRERLGHRYHPEELNPCTYSYSQGKLTDNSQALFGSPDTQGMPTIMVTFDSSFAEDPELVRNLLEQGMNVARINCAHDDEKVWKAMIGQIRRAEKITGKRCKIHMDLAGPKIRTVLLGKGKDKGKVKVAVGETIWLSETMEGFDDDTVVLHPNEKGIIASLESGHRILIDDGEIEGRVSHTAAAKAAVNLERISSKKGRIKSEKGINFPDTGLSIPSLTDFDRECLPFVCAHADIIGYSFVKNTADVRMLRKELEQIGNTIPALVYKIETPESVLNLPELILEGMRHPPFGIMIARGDLAVEIGFERMGEIQEEILWICEAAHVPVVWATQVLENLHKSGMPTRSEITDAGLASLAECIMVNKGKHTISVLKTLKEIMQRTSDRRNKKRFTLGALGMAKKFMRSS
ncbi:pyruvate kinase [Cyclobacterium lianum]|uniref:Pyruvate kinase n=1 Tax=Cyclobacterium lianum TaxID=388280 RepID=A0A1M7P8I9_9BACT|nr:pyruvate kinase [Cyclobacterium lianum]SHN12746.1 pyruvate kinase [Cyclobacterium lianum]